MMFDYCIKTWSTQVKGNNGPMLYAFLWVIPRRLNFICRRFGTLYLFRLVVFKSVSWYSNPSRGIQIRLVVFKSVSWYSNPSRGVQILHGIQIRLACKVNSLRLSCG